MLDRLSINELTTFRWSFEQDTLQYARHGFGGIGIWHARLDEGEIEDAADRLYAARLRVASYSCCTSLTGSESWSWEDALQEARQAIRTASRLGAPCMTIYPGSRRGHTRRHALRLVRNALHELLPYAMDYGVRLALEPMVGTGADQWTVFASPEDTLAFVGDYHPQALGLVMDMSMWPAERATGAAIAGLLPRLALVQLSDRSRESKCGFDRCLLGHGHTPCATWIRRLLDAGYNGMFEVELVGRSLEPYSYEHILAHVADVCGRWFKGEGAGTIPRRVAERLTAAPLPAIHPEP